MVAVQEVAHLNGLVEIGHGLFGRPPLRDVRWLMQHGGDDADDQSPVFAAASFPMRSPTSAIMTLRSRALIF